MKLKDFYTPENAARALIRYTEEYVSGAWLLSEKVRLHAEARRAFDPAVAEEARRQAFGEVYSTLRGRWQVFRGQGKHWTERIAFARLSEIAAEVGTATGWSLARFDQTGNLAPVIGALEGVRSIRTTVTSWGSPMAMSKFLHFLNPALFPIYDNEVVEKKVIHTFREEWVGFQPAIVPGTIRLHIGAIYLLKYLLFAADCMRQHRRALMNVFWEWAHAQVELEDRGESLGEEWRGFEAAAFEFVAIGAEACVRAEVS